MKQILFQLLIHLKIKKLGCTENLGRIRGKIQINRVGNTSI